MTRKDVLSECLQIAGLLVIAALLFGVALPIVGVCRAIIWLVYDGPLKIADWVHWRWLIGRQKRF